jgi:plasmid stabilization system protein ParE
VESGRQRGETATFGDVGVALPVVDDEAPEESGDEVEEVAADAIAQPRLHRVRQAAPPVAWRHRAKDYLVVPRRLSDEASQVVAAVLHRGRHCRLGWVRSLWLGWGGVKRQKRGEVRGLKWICVLWWDEEVVLPSGEDGYCQLLEYLHFML